jgi:hypothetical protein
MSLDSLINVTITVQGASVTRAGFGTIMLLAYHTNWPERVREYSMATVLTDMVTDGFATTDSAYLMAVAVASQNPRPPTLKIGRLEETPVAQSVKCTPTAVNNATYTVEIDGTEFEYEADATATVAEICTGLETAINAGSVAVTATDNTTDIDLTADAAGTYHQIKLSCDAGTRQWERDDETTDPGYATDLAAIVLEDNDFYGLAIEAHDAAAITAVAAWAETNKKLFCPTTGDTDCLGSGSTDIMSTEKALSHVQTAIWYSDDPSQYLGAGAMAESFPYNPGGQSWALKTISGVSAVSMTTTEKSNVHGKYGNYYVAMGGVNITWEGKTASGEWIDTVRGNGWLISTMQSDLFALVVGTRKVPYTTGGLGIIQTAMQGTLQLAESRNVLVAGSTGVIMPAIGDVSDADKIARALNGVSFFGQYAGAVHSMVIAGSLSY